MPNYGAWEFIVILIVVLTIWCACSCLFTKSLPGTIRQIRRMWRDADPDAHDNHR